MNGDEIDKQTWWQRIGVMLGITANTPQHPASGKFHPPATIVDAHAKVGAGLAATQAAAVEGSTAGADSDGIVPQPEKDIESECNCGGACEECKGKDIEQTVDGVDIENANPEGCNQYKPCGGGSDKQYAKADRLSKKAYDIGAEANEDIFVTPKDQAKAHKVAMKAHLKAAEAHKGTDLIHRHKEEAEKHKESWLDYDMAHQVSSKITGTKTFNEDTTMTRTEIITHLTTNCDCWKGGAETLNKLTDPQLITIKQNAEKATVLEAVAKEVGAPATLTANAFPAFLKKKIDAKKKKKDDDDEDEEEVENADPEEDDDDEEDDKMKDKKVANAKPPTLNEWRKMAPPEVVQAFDAAQEVVQNERTSLVSRLVANVAEADRPEVTLTLNTKSIPDLRLMAKLLPPVRNQQQVYQPLSIFAGAQGGPVGNSGKPAAAYEPGDGLEIPALVGNFAAEREAELKQQRA